MREETVELRHDLDANYNTTNLLLERVRQAPDKPLFSVQRQGTWRDISARRFLTDVQRLATTLMSNGVQPGDHVAIMSRTRYEWALVEEAIWFAGGISVPVYETSSAFQIEWILRDSGARVVFAENADQRVVIRQAAAQLGERVEVYLFDAGNPARESSIPSSKLSELLADPDQVSQRQLEAARSRAGLQDVATLVYTSGTTGRPKGCMMTHANFSLVAYNLVDYMRTVLGEDQRTLMFLPLAHVLARAVQQACIHGGAVIAHSPNTATLVEDLQAVKPGFLLAVPRVFEKIRNTALSKAEEGGKAKLFAQAEQVAIAYSKALQAKQHGTGRGPGLLLKSKHRLFDVLLYPKLREVFGGQCGYAISGASALNEDLAHFFRGAGIQLVEGYGLTETTAPATVNQPEHTKVGTVGRPIPGTSVRIAEDGEILIKGIGVFAGYHNNPKATAEMFTPEGYFTSGDTGELDAQGYLKVTGRKKELIVTAGGKNVAPGPLEETVRAERIVAHCILVGDNRPFISALVALDHEELALWAKARNLGELSLRQAATHPQVIAQVQQAVDAANLTVSKAESIRKFQILPDELTEASGHLTSSLKLKRQEVLDTYATVIGGLYQR
ncbi:Long-chain-fatty-acid--CoA ligase FadD15 [Glutamicibacter creatinolyticus]|uniref:Acyl-CoA synthetase n=1 Tax=Glutamicibacter creatinolyticus TaxID=162496 RepID=A0A5B7WQH6_9MICC|nr:long-chain fatty acid--CoA ligase [Glutamicibacter creatinolyticus]QCY46386.1 Long-chain-fatty-acid--CoA ligase FadD15 [Glutamicibacter creatinolyticus]